jgi:hypothetical protein
MAEIFKSSGNIAYYRDWSEHQDPMSYSEILEWLSDSRESYIGSSYYYIRSGSDTPTICRLNITGGSLYSMEVIDHIQYGITNGDIDEAILFQEKEPEIPGHCPISIHIEKKLRAILEI